MIENTFGKETNLYFGEAKNNKRHGKGKFKEYIVDEDDENLQILDNAYGILGIELMAAAQALDFGTHRLGDGVSLAKNIIRKYVDFLDIDRPLYEDHNTMKSLVKRCEIVNEIELSLGNLYEEKI